MAPVVRSHEEITWCKHSVQLQYWSGGQQCQVTGEIISAFSPQQKFLHKGRMDPAGLEPASATWTECYVPITPRALGAVSSVGAAMARSRVTILSSACQIGTKARKELSSRRERVFIPARMLPAPPPPCCSESSPYPPRSGRTLRRRSPSRESSGLAPRGTPAHPAA
jgi:hypothetical protein